MDEILDSADRPLNGQGWWMKSEEPWQTLACCMEVANAMRSPNHEGRIQQTCCNAINTIVYLPTL